MRNLPFILMFTFTFGCRSFDGQDGPCDDIADMDDVEVDSGSSIDSDTDIMVNDTGIFDTDSDEEELDHLYIGFTTALGPRGPVDLPEGGITDINVGGFLFNNDGDEPITVSQFAVSLWMVLGEFYDGFLPWGPPEEEQFFGGFINECRLVDPHDVNRVIAIGTYTDRAPHFLFMGDFTVEPGWTSGRILNVHCDFKEDRTFQWTSFAIDLPIDGYFDYVKSDADPIPDLGWSFMPRDYNGGELPLRSVTLPHEEPDECTLSIANHDLETEIDSLIAVQHGDQISIPVEMTTHCSGYEITRVFIEASTVGPLSWLDQMSDHGSGPEVGYGWWDYFGINTIVSGYEQNVWAVSVDSGNTSLGYQFWSDLSGESLQANSSFTAELLFMNMSNLFESGYWYITIHVYSVDENGNSHQNTEVVQVLVHN